MSADLATQIILVGAGLVTAGTSGLAALGVRRLLQGVDRVEAKVGEHGEQIAAMEVKLPNGEWKELKANVVTLNGSVATLSGEVRSIRSDLTAHFDGEISRHAETCAIAARVRPARVRNRKR